MMKNFSHYRVAYLHREKRVHTAYRDKVNPNFFVCHEVYPGTSEMHIVRQVQAIGGVMISMRKSKQRKVHLSEDYRVNFLTAISFAVRSGMSSGTALEHQILSESYPHREHFDPALRMIRAGASFSEALSVVGVYDDITMAILAAGEETGSLPQAIEAAISQQQRKSSSDTMTKTGLSILALDLAMSFISIGSTRFGILPNTEKQGIKSTDAAALEQWDTALSWAYALNDILLAITIVIGSFLFWVIYQHRYGDTADKDRIDKWISRVPFLGSAIQHAVVAASCGVMSRLMRGGVLFMKSASITVRTTRNSIVRTYWERAAQMVSAGTPVATALANDPMSAAERRILGSHGSQEQLSEALDQIAEYRTKLAEKNNKKFVYMAVIGGFVYSTMGIAVLLYVNWIQITAAFSSASA